MPPVTSLKAILNPVSSLSGPVSLFGFLALTLDQVLKVLSFSPLGSACSLQVQSLASTTHLVRVLKVRTTSHQSDQFEGLSLFDTSCLPVNLILSNAWKNITVERLFPRFPWKRSPSLSVMRSNVSFFCSRCRKCGTGGYLLTSTSSRKFDSCATDSSAPTNQHGPAAQAPPTRGGAPLLRCYLRVLFFSSAESIWASSKVRRQF